MARKKEFIIEDALEAAISVFREHGYAGTSTQMLVKAMNIGKQSLYDTFGDKWELYCTALTVFSNQSVSAHIDAVKSASGVVAGIECMLDRVIVNPDNSCLGISSICEFGVSKAEILQIRKKAMSRLNNFIRETISSGIASSEIPPNIDPDEATYFIISSIASIKLAGRSGSDVSILNHIKAMTLRVIR
ncbi:TetR/AcrR family transcriptional regulator [Providencia rettgeri]